MEFKPTKIIRKAEIPITLGAYTDIIALDFPSRVNTDVDIEWNFLTHLRVTPPAAWTNLGLGIQYMDGPQDKIMVDSLEIARGGIAGGKGSIPSTCTNTKLAGTIKGLASAGDYRFRFLAGHIEDDTFYVDSLLETYLTATTPPAPPEEGIGIDITAMMEPMMSMMVQFMSMFILMSMMMTMMRMMGETMRGAG